MPNLKKVGLLPDRLLPKYEELGVSSWIDAESDYETSWEELKNACPTCLSENAQR